LTECKDRQLAEQLQKQLDNEIKKNNDPSAMIDLDIKDLIDQFLKYTSQNASQKVKDYRTVSKRLEYIYYLSPLTIRPDDIASMVRHLRNERRLSQESIRKAVILLRQIFRFGIKHGYCFENPAIAVKISKRKNSRRTFWFDYDEMNRIIDICLNRPEYEQIGDYFVLLYYTGARASELLTIKKKHIIKINPTLWVLNIEDSKTPNGIRKIPLHVASINLLKKRLENLADDDDWVFKSPSTDTHWNIYYLIHKFKKIMNEVTTRDHFGVSLHSLRHTCASHLIQRGATIEEVRDILGHSSRVITDIYAHLSDKGIAKAVQRLPNYIDDDSPEPENLY